MNKLNNVFLSLLIAAIIQESYSTIFNIFDLTFESEGLLSIKDHKQPKKSEQPHSPHQRFKRPPPPNGLPVILRQKLPFRQFRDKQKRQPPFRFIDHKNQLFREGIYNRNLERINLHNQDPYRTYNQEVNSFALLDQDEFLSIYATLQPNRRRRRVLQKTAAPNKTVDYSYAAGPVRNQGLCGACYAFASVDAIAAQRYVRGCPFNVLLSPQDLVTNSPNFGCAGGSLEISYDYMQKNGVFYEWAYPYQNQYSQSSIKTSANAPFAVGAAVFTGYFDISGCDYLVDALERSGPLPVGIDAKNLAFYSGGTFSSDGTNINHGVVLLSYDPTKGFYTQNSWGAGWGLSGFAWIDPNNNAGICHYAVQFTIKGENQQDCFSF